MTPLRAVMRWDARTLARSRAAWIALVVLSVATGLGVCSGARFRARWSDEATHERRLEQESRREHLALLAENDPRAAMPMFIDTKIALPPAPLAELIVGRGDLDPRGANVSAFSHRGSLFRDYQTASPVALAIGRFDLGFVVVYLFPLIVIALGYGLLSDERDRGLDRLLAVHGVSRWRLALGRVALRSVLVAAPLIAGVATIFLVEEPTVDRAARCAVAMVAILGYAGFWWSLVLVVASSRLREGTSLLALLVAWVVVVLIVPAIVGAVTKTTHPAPSRFALIAASRSAEVAAATRAQQLIGGYVHDHPEMDPKATGAPPAFAQRSFVVAREIDEAVKPIVAEFDHALEAQQTAVARFQLLSPALLVHRTLSSIAGTDETRALAFRAQARTFAHDWRETVGSLGMRGVTVDAAMVTSRPELDFVEPPLGDTLGVVAPPIAMLWGFTLLAGFAAFRRLRRD
ncbi:MAG: DUF3526 domain-containing protein [Deltaproteobacteria bacterium]|nr:DUF3526 domain-containing protein [Nannocystaceae bacterium]